MPSNICMVYIYITSIVQGHPGAGGEPGLLGADGCNGTRGRPGVDGIPGFDGLHGQPASKTPHQIFLLLRLFEHYIVFQMSILSLSTKRKVH